MKFKEVLKNENPWDNLERQIKRFNNYCFLNREHVYATGGAPGNSNRNSWQTDT